MMCFNGFRPVGNIFVKCIRGIILQEVGHCRPGIIKTDHVIINQAFIEISYKFVDKIDLDVALII